MKRRFLGVSAACLCLAAAVPASAAPPDSPSATGQCASAIAQDRTGPPADPSVSFPFECPPPPGHRAD
jgi:hypothetical protein